MGQTAAQRHNNKMDAIFNTYKLQEQAKKDFLPTCNEYSFFLSKAVSKFNINTNEARNKFGTFTHGQWKELLGLF